MDAEDYARAVDKVPPKPPSISSRANLINNDADERRMATNDSKIPNIGSTSEAMDSKMTWTGFNPFGSDDSNSDVNSIIPVRTPIPMVSVWTMRRLIILSREFSLL